MLQSAEAGLLDLTDAGKVSGKANVPSYSVFGRYPRGRA
jgi:hypothetical protein